MFSQLKRFLRDTLALSPDLVMVIVGFVSYLLLCLILRKPVGSAWGLLAPIIIGALVECYEIWMQYGVVGLFTPENDPLVIILLRHGLDILKMLIFSAIFVVIVKIGIHYK